MTDTEAKLNVASEALASALVQDGWNAAPLPPKGYQVKVEMSRDGMPVGSAVIYHSKKKGYSFVTGELKSPKAVEAATRAWVGIEGGGPGGAERASSGARQVAGGTVVYVDGSFREDAEGIGTATYGLVALQNGQAEYEEAGVVDREGWTVHRNVGGEMMAVLKALDWAKSVGLGEITVAYDYEGLEKWATGEWNARKPATQSYRDAVGDSPVSVTAWLKIDAHTGDHWNDRADALAKSALPSSTEDPDVTRQRRLDELMDAYVRIRDAAAEAGYVLAITLDREDLLKFSISLADRDVGSGHLYPKKDGPSLKLHECWDESAQEALRELWDRRRVRPPAGGSNHALPGAELARTTHALSALAPYKGCRVDISPLRDALRSDLIEASRSDQITEKQAELAELADDLMGRELSWAVIESEIETARAILRLT